MVADSPQVIGMSRTYDGPGGEAAGTFGQSLPAVPFDDMIPANEIRRIIFMSQGPRCPQQPGLRQRGSLLGVSRSTSACSTPSAHRSRQSAWTCRRGHTEQINRIFGDYAPVDGYVDVSTATVGGEFYCYGSVLPNEKTSDPTTILPQVPSDTAVFIPAAAMAAGVEGAFYETDVDLNNTGDSAIAYTFTWLPRGLDNGSAEESDLFQFEWRHGGEAGKRTSLRSSGWSPTGWVRC